MDKNNLNLARKWRSKNFEEIIGQDLSVRMLKNSLFLNKFFPVYLFSGQRGCGKTSTARIFAMSLNCEKLPDFQEQPKNVQFPCLKCKSCISMQGNKHPDFIEIDAASNTGVDNIRQIIDSSSFLPLLGRRKIYLIDEAHMLSKAAFNAFLKILEEPPASVIFMLATTDIDKIIETVKSRCFQLFFSPVKTDILVSHLENICKEEEIDFKIDALEVLAKESEGSVRDAINLLEQVRFSTGKVTIDCVLRVLGHIADENLLKIFEILLNGNTSELLNYLQEIKFYDFSAENLWKKNILVLRTAIWIKCDLEPKFFSQFLTDFKRILKEHTLKKLSLILETFYNNELNFIKVTDKHAFLESIMIQICLKNIESLNRKVETIPIIESKTEEKAKDNLNPETENKQWDSFLQSVGELDDPLLNSVFNQAVFLNMENNLITIEFAKQLGFFKDLLDESKDSWLKLLKKNFSESVELKMIFNQNKSVDKSLKNNNLVTSEKNLKNKDPKALDITDKDKWKKANLLMEQFSGSIHPVEDEDE